MVAHAGSVLVASFFTRGFFSFGFWALDIILLLALASGCSTTKQTAHTEELLVSSGFKEVIAATPDQLAQLRWVLRRSWT